MYAKLIVKYIGKKPLGRTSLGQSNKIRSYNVFLCFSFCAMNLSFGLFGFSVISLAKVCATQVRHRRTYTCNAFRVALTIWQTLRKLAIAACIRVAQPLWSVRSRAKLPGLDFWSRTFSRLAPIVRFEFTIR